MARANGSIRARGGVPARSKSVVNACSVVAIGAPCEADSVAPPVTYRNLGEEWPVRQSRLDAKRPASLQARAVDSLRIQAGSALRRGCRRPGRGRLLRR